MKTHNVYEPNEYEQMLIAAGWITAESCDPEYLDYQRWEVHNDQMTYEHWKHLRAEWNRLSAEYEAAADRRQNQLVDQMSHIEYILGY